MMQERTDDALAKDKVMRARGEDAKVREREKNRRTAKAAREREKAALLHAAEQGPVLARWETEFKGRIVELERELGVDAALAETELRRVMAAHGIGPPDESPLAGAQTPAAAPPPRKSSRQRKASTRARESEEPLEPPQKRSRRADCDARRRAAKKSKLDEFNDLERRVAALIGRVTELEEELRRRRRDDGLDDDDAQSPRVADAL